MQELRIGLSLTPFTFRYGSGKGCVVFPFRAEYERDLILGRERALIDALRRISTLRPAGDVATCANARALVQQMEVIAVRALKTRSLEAEVPLESSAVAESETPNTSREGTPNAG